MKKTIMHIYIDEELKEKAEKKAKNLGLTLSSYIRYLVIQNSND